jgi:hypothetical protein
MTVLENVDVSYLDQNLFDEEKHLLVKPASFYQNIPQNHLSLWGHFHGVYCFPTVELIDWLKNHIISDKTIEIGAGVGTIGRSLEIPITDSCYMKNNEQVRIAYAMMRQPITEYPNDIIELNAIEAINQYKPEVVIGSWITHKYDEKEHWREGNQFGVDERYILKNVKKYIMIGNEKVHDKKPILEMKHQEFRFPWLFSRSVNFQSNIIYVWEN